MSKITIKTVVTHLCTNDLIKNMLGLLIGGDNPILAHCHANKCGFMTQRMNIRIHKFNNSIY